MNPSNSHSTGFQKSTASLARLFVFVLSIFLLSSMQARSDTLLVDDFADSELISALGTKWRGVSDKVMGGVSIVRLERGNAEGRAFLRLKGDVRLENNGGFVQAALDLEPSGGVLDASGYRGLRITVRGNSQKYSLHLRTSDATLPWQSYRAHFFASDRWQEIDIPFADFVPYRIDKALDSKSLKRIGVVAIGRAFSADVLISNMYFYE